MPVNFSIVGDSRQNIKLETARQKFIGGVRRQIAALNNPEYTYLGLDCTGCAVRRRPLPWVQIKKDETYIGFRYGARFMRRNGVAFGILLKSVSKKKIAEALHQVIEMVRNGDFDSDLIEARKNHEWQRAA